MAASPGAATMQRFGSLMHTVVTLPLGFDVRADIKPLWG